MQKNKISFQSGFTSRSPRGLSRLQSHSFTESLTQEVALTELAFKGTGREAAIVVGRVGWSLCPCCSIVLSSLGQSNVLVTPWSRERGPSPKLHATVSDSRTTPPNFRIRTTPTMLVAPSSTSLRVRSDGPQGCPLQGCHIPLSMAVLLMAPKYTRQLAYSHVAFH